MKKILWLVGMTLILAGCASQANPGNLTLQSLGPAPEIENDVWINTKQPLRLANLRGQVVLVEMWTYG